MNNEVKAEELRYPPTGEHKTYEAAKADRDNRIRNLITNLNDPMTRSYAERLMSDGSEEAVQELRKVIE